MPPPPRTTTAPGSSTHLFLNQLLSQHGVAADEVAVIGVGAAASAVAAMRQGGIDGMVHLDPVISQLETAGELKVIVDTRTAEGAQAVFGGSYHAACLYAKADFLAANPLDAIALQETKLPDATSLSPTCRRWAGVPPSAASAPITGWRS
jgi:NitT/TauT family transport system substrate-binding protein